jgi:hypothetical protein
LAGAIPGNNGKEVDLSRVKIWERTTIRWHTCDIAKRTQSPAIRPMSTHGKISHIVSPSDVRSEVVVKNFCSQLLLAVLCLEAEIPIHTAAIENAATVIRACRVVYLLNSTAFSCLLRK